jgi:uncharacterized protein YndB with AHSA1/START domain
MVDIIHRIGIKASPTKVYAALSTVDGVAGWWTRETTGESKVGGVITVRFLDGAVTEKGRMDLEVTRLDPGKEVRWRVKAGPQEWIDTDVTFSLSQADGQTVIVFGQASVHVRSGRRHLPVRARARLSVLLLHHRGAVLHCGSDDRPLLQGTRPVVPGTGCHRLDRFAAIHLCGCAIAACQ